MNLQAIVKALDAAGITATLEHPGYIAVMTNDGEWNFGTANGDWQGDLIVDGEPVNNADLGLMASDSKEAVAAAIQRVVTMRYYVTAANLLDVLQRAKSVIEELEGADEHGELIRELGGIVTLLETEIGASHMGTGADMPLIQRGDA